MKANMGGLDRIIRLVVAAVVAVLYWQGYIEGILAYILMAVAAIFVLTSLVNFCPLYTLFGFSSGKIKK